MDDPGRVQWFEDEWIDFFDKHAGRTGAKQRSHASLGPHSSQHNIEQWSSMEQPVNSP